ncbi:MAG: 5-(carboxyamino)imidazole ribonucleotide synthase [Spirochaetaceae bacterium]|nr:5-(carboxyamino)imidazole ribonucleotide synthase [Spirochaetaceae bacterium]
MSGGMVRRAGAPDPLLPGATIGILGSGQLGRMLAGAAASLGYRVHVYSPEAGSPAGLVAACEVVGSYADVDAIAAFAAGVDVLTFEFENLSGAAVAAAERRTMVHPGAEVLATAQNRRTEKQFLGAAGFPVAAWRALPAAPAGERGAAADRVAADIGYPAIVKTAGFGYDGKGQRRVHDAGELAAARRAAAGEPLIVEQVVPFDRELSVIGARTAGGEYRDFGPFENVHARHILDLSSAPAAGDPAVLRRARELVRTLVEQLRVVGLLCVELFEVAGDLLVNEVAPRPHNSGHLTLDACATSQFEQHVRAVCGLPLGDPVQHTPAAMANLLGDLWPAAAAGIPADTGAGGAADAAAPPWHEALAAPNVKLHLYGKREARRGRKMGHLTALADTAARAAAQALAARSLLG